jgi:hypothetical protein
MQSKTSRIVGWIPFGIGALYMAGLGWLYSWWVVPATREMGPVLRMRSSIMNMTGPGRYPLERLLET